MILTGRLPINMVKLVIDLLILGQVGVSSKCDKAVSHRVAVKGFLPYCSIRYTRANGTVHKGGGHSDCSRCMAKSWIVDFEIFSVNRIELM